MKIQEENTVSKSSAEAEYRVLVIITAEVTWISILMSDLKIHRIGLAEIHCNNKAAIHIANNPVLHERTKHIEIDCHFVQEKLQQKLISLQHVRSSNQQADILTALGGDAHKYIMSKLGVFDLYNSNLRGSVKAK